jgi:hypothetical protein
MLLKARKCVESAAALTVAIGVVSGAFLLDLVHTCDPRRWRKRMS